MDYSDGCTTIRICLILLNYTLKMVKIVNFKLCTFYQNKNLENNFIGLYCIHLVPGKIINLQSNTEDKV